MGQLQHHADIMKDVYRTSTAIREALESIDLSNLSAQHKLVLTDVAERALRNAEENDRAVAADSIEDDRWLPDEVQIVAVHLEGKVAVNWQHADEQAMWLATRLNRSPAEIRKKATELGLGASIDYRIARSQTPRVEPE
ncbi:MAG: hypothetical protein H7Y02_03810 [Candidatus Obscuribacterales bacterium]|nr:hypothetical protein [Steroidobacteraceae bacterium]